jgi:O-antigen/teichoic acid export membrane protein
MANIRKQAIISSILVYFGFLVGAINTYFYVTNGSFTPAQFGLTRIFFDVATNFYAFGCLGVIPVMYKFYPYYKANLPDKENDLLTWSLLTAFIGFIALVCLSFLFEPLVVRKFSEKSQLFVDYYYWVFPFAFGMLFFSVLEGFSWALQKTVLTNALKETVLRIITTIFILLFYFEVINFDTFIKLFATLYFFIFAILLIYLIRIGKFHLVFKVSRVTRKFKKKMFLMQSLVFGGVIIQSIGYTIDTLIIASIRGLNLAGIFNLAQYAANLVQIPQRSVQAITTGILAQHWKDKNFSEIHRIYKRSSINLLLLALFIYGNIVLNIHQAFDVLPIQTAYRAGIDVMIVLGIARIIDAGTGVNGTIIGTSNYWKFDFISGVIMLALRIPVTYYFIKTYGIVGSAYAEVIAYTVYNFIRFEFLRRKYNMVPFDIKTVYAILLSAIAFTACWFVFKDVTGWIGIFIRTLVFSSILIGGIFYWKITPDAYQLYDNFKNRFRSS